MRINKSSFSDDGAQWRSRKSHVSPSTTKLHLVKHILWHSALPLPVEHSHREVSESVMSTRSSRRPHVALCFPSSRPSCLASDTMHIQALHSNRHCHCHCLATCVNSFLLPLVYLTSSPLLTSRLSLFSCNSPHCATTVPLLSVFRVSGRRATSDERRRRVDDGDGHTSRDGTIEMIFYRPELGDDRQRTGLVLVRPRPGGRYTREAKIFSSRLFHSDILAPSLYQRCLSLIASTSRLHILFRVSSLCSASPSHTSLISLRVFASIPHYVGSLVR